MGTKIKFSLVVIALEVQFWFPVWFIFLLDRGFTVGHAAFADGLFRFVATVAEVPAGWIADRVGRKSSLYFALIGTTITFLLIAGVSNLATLAVAWSVWGILWALVSGLLTAYGWEIGLETQGGGTARAADYVRLRRISASVAMMLSLVTAGALYQYSATLPFTITAALALMAIPVAAGLPAVSGSSGTAKVATGDLRLTLAGPIRVALFAGAVVLVAGWSIQMVFQPMGLEAGLTPTGMSFLFAAYALAQLVGAWSVGKFRASRSSVLVLSVFGISTMCVGVWVGLQEGFPAWIALGCLVAMGLFYSVGTTYCDIWVSELSSAKNRATMLSLVSLLGGIALIATRPLLGLAAGAWGPGAAFGMWAVVCALLAWVLRAVERGGHSCSSDSPAADGST